MLWCEMPHCVVNSTMLPIVALQSAWCVGKMTEDRYFSVGSIGAFMNSLSSRSIIDSCGMTVFLLNFGCENWILSETSLHTLEVFLGELAKRASLDLEMMRS